MMEDLQSSLANASKILQNNGVENYNQVIKDLQNIYDTVQFESNEHLNSRTDRDIVALAFLFVGGTNLNEIQELYRQYCNSKNLYSQSTFSNWINEIQSTIQQNKWFRPSEEKNKFIRSKVIDIISKIHAGYTPPKNRIQDSNYQKSNEDIVFENDKIVVILADSMAKCITYGDPNLCISYPIERNYYWKYRLGKQRSDGMGMSTYFITWKDSNNKILIDALGNDNGGSGKYSWNPIKPNHDMDITKEELIKNFPDLKEPFDNGIFKFIPYGENENRAYEIIENVTSILDSELDGFNDYDIFVQSGIKIPNEDWDELQMDLKTKKILFKKYLNNGHYVSMEYFNKYGEKIDLPWYLDLISRSKQSSIQYIFDVGLDNVKDENILNYYNEELVRVKELEQQIRNENSDYIYLHDTNLYFLPNLEDLEVIDFYCSHNHLISLKGCPKNVKRNFECKYNKLLSLEGCPKIIKGHFYCNNNDLVTLEDGPDQVEGTYNCSYNKLTSLKGAPDYVGGTFNCSFNRLVNLEGSPKKVKGKFECYDIRRSNYGLTSLQGAPDYVGKEFNCKGNKLESLIGAPAYVGSDFECSFNNLVTLKGAPEFINGFFRCEYNKLPNLEGAPKIVKNYFNTNNNNLSSLRGSPQYVGQSFECSNNNLETLEGCTQNIGTHFRCDTNNLKNLIGGPKRVGENYNCSNNDLESLKGAPKYLGGSFSCLKNENLKSLKGLPKINEHVLHVDPKHRNTIEYKNLINTGGDFFKWRFKFKAKLADIISNKIEEYTKALEESKKPIKESYNFSYILKRIIDMKNN